MAGILMSLAVASGSILRHAQVNALGCISVIMSHHQLLQDLPPLGSLRKAVQSTAGRPCPKAALQLSCARVLSRHKFQRNSLI